MTQLHQLRAVLFSLLILFAQPILVAAGESTPAMTVGERGAALYARQDTHSAPIAKLPGGEPLFIIAEAVGTETWYMVRTNQGVIGWVRSADVIVGSGVREIFQEKETAASTWAAVAADGRTFRGTWSAEPIAAERSARGTWTLRDSGGAAKLRGGWTAEMHATGWNGTWRASVEGRKNEYQGSWSVEMESPQNARFADLFEAAARDATRGIWTAGRQSGSWSIRVVR
jgi:hypothetical protein